MPVSASGHVPDIRKSISAAFTDYRTFCQVRCYRFAASSNIKAAVGGIFPEIIFTTFGGVFKMAKKIVAYVKLQIPAGKALPAPPVGPALGQHGVNIAGFVKEFNEKTKKDMGLIIPVVITIYADRSFTFITKTPPAAVLIKKACNIESGSGEPNKTKVATITREQCRKIGEQKMADLNAASVEAAASDRRYCSQHGRTVVD